MRSYAFLLQTSETAFESVAAYSIVQKTWLEHIACIFSIETFYREGGGIRFTPKDCYPSIRTLGIIIRNIDFVLKFISSVTTGKKNLIDIFNESFAKMRNMLRVVYCVKSLDMLCATYFHPPTHT